MAACEVKRPSAECLIRRFGLRTAGMVCMRSFPVWALLPTLAACNSYEWFRVTGYVQQGFTNKADILFVIDNSSSMTDEATALAQNFSDFVTLFADEQPPTDPDLTNDVERFLAFVGDPTGNVNYQLGVTNTDVSMNAGKLLGDFPVVGKTDSDVAGKFLDNLVCKAACIEDVPSDIGVACRSGGQCATSASGSEEEPIEAVFMAMCRAVENPPDACFQPWWPDEDGSGWSKLPPGDTGAPDTDGPAPTDYFSNTEVMTNAGFLREGSVVIPVIITDEGDQSRRIDARDGSVFPYDQYFKQFGHRMTWAVIGPSEDATACKGPAADWGIHRMERMVYGSDGLYVPISLRESAESCVNADFSQALVDIGKLLRALSSSFALQSTPVQGTIVVTVDGKQVPESTQALDPELDIVVFSDGWSYRATDNTVILHGSAVPDASEDVRVYYLPSGGSPRDLPF